MERASCHSSVPLKFEEDSKFYKKIVQLDSVREANELEFHPDSMNWEDGLVWSTSWKTLGHSLKEWRKLSTKDAS